MLKEDIKQILKEFRGHISEKNCKYSLTDRIYWDGELRLGKEMDKILETFLSQSLTKIAKKAIEAVEEDFDEVLKNGHGGGNWRRLIIQKQKELKDKNL